MSTPASRVSAGVPTGGQFAPTGHAESDVSLGSSGAPADWKTASHSRFEAERVADLTLIRHMARGIREQHPDAAFLEMDVSDQGSDSMWAVAVLDADGQNLAEADDITVDGDELEDMCFELTDNGPWIVHRAYPFGRPMKYAAGRPCLDLAASAAITDEELGAAAPDDPTSSLAPSDPMVASTRLTVGTAVAAAFASMSDREAEQFEQAALQAGLLGRCESCGLNVGLTDKGGSCPECQSTAVEWQGADI